MRASASHDDQLLFELQSRSSVPSLVTTASSSEDSDELSDLQSRRSLDAALGRLSCLSSIAKFAMKLNQIHHVKICATYDESEGGATVYVMNVYLRYVQKGLPPPPPAGESEVSAEAAAAREGARAPRVPGGAPLLGVPRAAEAHHEDRQRAQ